MTGGVCDLWESARRELLKLRLALTSSNEQQAQVLLALHLQFVQTLNDMVGDFLKYKTGLRTRLSTHIYQKHEPNTKIKTTPQPRPAEIETK